MFILDFFIQTISGIYYLLLGISSGGSYPRKLTASEEDNYLKQLAQGSTEARNKLIEHNLRLVAHVCRKYYQTAVSFDDMLSIGTIGLIKAVDSFRQDKGTRFSSYAARCIENECLMFLRASKKHSLDTSLSDPIETDKHGNELTLSDVIASDDSTVQDIEERQRSILLLQAVDMLEPREQEIIRLRYGLDNKDEMTQKKVADRLGISRSYVSRIEKKAIARLRELLPED